MDDLDWDEDNLRHIAQHGISAEEVEFILGNPTRELEYQDWHSVEERFQEAGMTASGRILVVVTTIRGNRARVVTAYDAPKQVIEAYFKSG